MIEVLLRMEEIEDRCDLNDGDEIDEDGFVGVEKGELIDEVDEFAGLYRVV